MTFEQSCVHRHVLFQCRPVDISFMTIWTGHTVVSFATTTSFTVDPVISFAQVDHALLRVVLVPLVPHLFVPSCHCTCIIARVLSVVIACQSTITASHSPTPSRATTTPTSARVLVGPVIVRHRNHLLMLFFNIHCHCRCVAGGIVMQWWFGPLPRRCIRMN